MTIETAQGVLEAIRTGRWSWMKVKRFKPEAHETLEARYAALDSHHVEETTFLVAQLQESLELVEQLRAGN